MAKITFKTPDFYKGGKTINIKGFKLDGAFICNKLGRL